MKEETIEEMFTGRSDVSRLHELGLRTLTELTKACLNDQKEYTPLPFVFPEMQLYRFYNSNYFVAYELQKRGIISQQELEKQVTLETYYPGILKKKSARALHFNKVYTVGDACKKCINADGSFNHLKGKKIGPRVNHDLAAVLKHLKFLSEEEFIKVPLPRWKFRFPTDEEIGEDGNRDIAEMPWSQEARELIRHAVHLKFPWQLPLRLERPFDGITLGELVKTFVRIHTNGEPVFYTKGHRGAHWHTTEWFNERFEKAFEEIKRKLKEMNFLVSEQEIM